MLPAPPLDSLSADREPIVENPAVSTSMTGDDAPTSASDPVATEQTSERIAQSQNDHDENLARFSAECDASFNLDNEGKTSLLGSTHTSRQPTSGPATEDSSLEGQSSGDTMSDGSGSGTSPSVDTPPADTPLEDVSHADEPADDDHPLQTHGPDTSALHGGSHSDPGPTPTLLNPQYVSARQPPPPPPLPPQRNAAQSTTIDE